MNNKVLDVGCPKDRKNNDFMGSWSIWTLIITIFGIWIVSLEDLYKGGNPFSLLHLDST